MDDVRRRANAAHASGEAWRVAHAVALAPFWKADQTHPASGMADSFHAVCAGIRSGDQRAIDVAVALVCDDPKLPFGKTIKCSLARALNSQRALLSRLDVQRLSERLALLAALPFPPTELKYIRRLVRAPSS